MSQVNAIVYSPLFALTVTSGGETCRTLFVTTVKFAVGGVTDSTVFPVFARRSGFLKYTVVLSSPDSKNSTFSEPVNFFPSSCETSVIFAKFGKPSAVLLIGYWYAPSNDIETESNVSAYCKLLPTLATFGNSVTEIEVVGLSTEIPPCDVTVSVPFPIMIVAFSGFPIGFPFASSGVTGTCLSRAYWNVSGVLGVKIAGNTGGGKEASANPTVTKKAIMQPRLRNLPSPAQCDFFALFVAGGVSAVFWIRSYLLS